MASQRQEKSHTEALRLLSEVAGGNFLTKVIDSSGAKDVWECPFCKNRYSHQPRHREWVELGLHDRDCLQMRAARYFDEFAGPDAADNLDEVLKELEAMEGLKESVRELEDG